MQVYMHLDIFASDFCIKKLCKARAVLSSGLVQNQDKSLEYRAYVVSNPEGSISHEETIENRQLVIIDEWESKEAYEAFINNVAGPALGQAGISPSEVEEL